MVVRKAPILIAEVLKKQIKRKNMIYFNAETMKFFGTNSDFYLSVGEVLNQYKENFENGPINQKIRSFE
jgi:hypothetical protein